MRDTVEGQQVVLAGAVDLDVADQDHLVVSHVEGAAQDLGGILTQAGEDLGVRAGHPVRCVEQPFAVGILPDREEQLTDRGGGALKINPRWGRHTHRPAPR